MFLKTQTNIRVNQKQQKLLSKVVKIWSKLLEIHLHATARKGCFTYILTWIFTTSLFNFYIKCILAINLVTYLAFQGQHLVNKKQCWIIKKIIRYNASPKNISWGFSGSKTHNRSVCYGLYTFQPPSLHVPGEP